MQDGEDLTNLMDNQQTNKTIKKCFSKQQISSKDLHTAAGRTGLPNELSVQIYSCGEYVGDRDIWKHDKPMTNFQVDGNHNGKYNGWR